jgi:hypothetical protein
VARKKPQATTKRKIVERFISDFLYVIARYC